MADITKTNVLLNFAHGQESNLPTTHAQGTIYITTDTKRMYVDLPGTSDRLCLSNFEMVTTLPAVNTLQKGEENQFYVKKTAKADNTGYTYSLHCVDGNAWKEVINTVALENAIADLAEDIEELDGRVSDIEDRLDDYDSAWTELPDTYVKKSGDTMSGNLNMGSKNITNLASGGTTETNAANIGDVNSAVSSGISTHAAVKATGTVLGHVKLSDATNSSSDAAAGIAATPNAVKAAYDLASQAKSKAEAVESDASKTYVKLNGTKEVEELEGGKKRAKGQEIVSHLTLDGQLRFVGSNADQMTSLNMNGFPITNVKDPSANLDAVNKKYVDTTASALTGTKSANDKDTTAPTLYDLKYALAAEAETRASADTALDGRVDAIEAVIDGVTGAMHFIGAFENAPEKAFKGTANERALANGDVYVNTKNHKEYVYSNNAWVELGDTTQEAQRIGVLEEEINGKTGVKGLKERMADAEEAIGALESYDAELTGRVDKNTGVGCHFFPRGSS